MSKTVAVVIATQPAHALGDDPKIRLQVLFPEPSDIDSAGNITLDPRRVRFGLVAKGLKPIGDWDSGTNKIEAETLIDFGIHHSQETEANTEVLDEIKAKFKRGALSGHDDGGYSLNIDIDEVSPIRVWAVPVLPDVTEASKSANLKDRKVYTLPDGRKHYGRDFGPEDDVHYMNLLRKAVDHVLLLGQPGVGKSALALAAFGEELITMVCSAGTTTADLVGQFISCPATDEYPLGIVWVPGPLSIAAAEGRPIFLDEVMRVADPDELSPIFPCLDGRKKLLVEANPSIGEIEVKEGFFLIAAANEDELGANISKALSDRLVEHIDVRSDYPLARALGVHEKFVDFAEQMEALRVAGEVDWAPQLRSCLRANRIIERAGLSHAVANELGQCPEISRPEAIRVASDVFDIENPSILAIT